MNTAAISTIFAGAALLLLHKVWRMRSKKSVRGKVVFITGASSGIGEACAHLFYRHGAKLILSARRVEELERVKSELLSQKGDGQCFEPHIVPLDLSDWNSLPDKAKEAHDLHGRIDILINNGGISLTGDVLTTNMDIEMKLMCINYFGTVALTKAVLPYMVKQKSGTILAVSSLQGKMSLPYKSAYGASKHALQAFCDSLRAEIAKHNISVCVYCPSYIRTNLSMNALNPDGSKSGVMSKELKTGMPVHKAAEEILDSVQYNKSEVLSGPLHHQFPAYFRSIFSGPYFKYMEMEAAKEHKL